MLGLDAVEDGYIFIVPCYALHVPQHVAVSLSEPLNAMMSSSTPYTKNRTRHIQTQQGLVWNNPSFFKMNSGYS